MKNFVLVCQLYAGPTNFAIRLPCTVRSTRNAICNNENNFSGGLQIPSGGDDQQGITFMWPVNKERTLLDCLIQQHFECKQLVRQKLLEHLLIHFSIGPFEAIPPPCILHEGLYCTREE